MGGSPCQGFSFAGKCLNFDDPRSRLFFDYVNVLNHVKPKYFLLENVKMKKEYQDIISEYLGVQPIEINSSLVSAQNRVRLYWTNIPNVDVPNDKGLTWKDVADDSIKLNKYLYTEKSLSWLKEQGYIRDNKHKDHTDGKQQDKKTGRYFNEITLKEVNQSVAAMRGRYINGTKGKTAQFIEFRKDGKTNCLTTVQKDNVVVPFTHHEKVLAENYIYRYMTPKEYERLQTVPENYTDSVSDTQRFKMLGNGWTVEVIAHILNYINKVK
ncbi:hypothetical protein J1TS3_36810 [Siminovitchia fordii]|uniref:DNA (cytosine-5-)-methyltransferase n=2 Tax=Siminovitchia fordii TaxID=254759 RepID=A0ABQ4KBZ7_9BACI|nr:hypothetical protein J1TS3_36810 [Siminovitchia fordii]